MFNFFKKKEKVPYLGVVLETKAELASRPHFEEIVASANPVNWKVLDPNLFKYPIRNQDGSSSCVAATRALVWSIMYFKKSGDWVDFSFAWPYAHRSNKPSGGMNAVDALEKGMIPDALMPSDNRSEDTLNNYLIRPWLYDTAKDFLMGTPIVLPEKDIEIVASVIETTGKPVQLFFVFGNGEWTKAPKVVATTTPYCHSVTAIDYGMYDGEKALLIQDSWGNDLNTINGKRIVKESFYTKRNIFAQYFIKFKFEQTDKPIYDGSIKSLQDCLKFEQVFPSNVTSTGTFGPVTKQAVIDFQKKYGLDPVGVVGPLTTKKLKELYGAQ